ncbi:MAG TPA: pyrroloquinoline quinone biosynthesis protein PqqE [Polyangiaceae bacterium]
MSAPRPYTLIAEVSYRCPLHCAYCSNPADLKAHGAEISTDDWLRTIDQAADLGVVQIHFTGGEPLSRSDLEILVERARKRELYVNLVTSGVPLDRDRLVRLRDAGVDHVQLSVQASDRETSLKIADYDAFDAKRSVARWVKELDLPLTINVVMHRANLDRVEDLIALAESMKADRLELANAQWQGFALANRAALMPSFEQLDHAQRVALAAKDRLKGKMDVLFVKPDYFSEWPRACMDGWARRFVQVIPDGTVVPCHQATSITTLTFEKVTERSLGDIWENSPAMNAFRGDDWMQEPCASCERKTIDFGGCRCQAFALTGDAAATDPACKLAPTHGLVRRAKEEVPRTKYLYRGR